MESLRNEFKDDQQYRKDELSKKAKDNEGTKTKIDLNNMTLQRQERLKQLEMDENMVNQEEAFFQKWLKQKENLGNDKFDSSSAQRNLSASKAPGSVKKLKDVTNKQLDSIDQQIRKDRIMKNYNVEKRQVRKALNVNSISDKTIEAFISYLDITETDTDYDVSKKLNAAATLDARKNYNSRVSNNTQKTIPEDKNEDINDRAGATINAILDQKGGNQAAKGKK